MEDQLPKTNNSNKVLRTFSSDMAEAVRENEMSVIKIALAEKERREQEDLYKKAKGTKLSRFLFVFLGLIIISVVAVKETNYSYCLSTSFTYFNCCPRTKDFTSPGRRSIRV